MFSKLCQLRNKIYKQCIKLLVFSGERQSRNKIYKLNTYIDTKLRFSGVKGLRSTCKIH